MEYLDLIQINPHEFNNELRIKREQYAKEHGALSIFKILNKDQHHPLKSTRSADYRLSQEELNKLIENGIYFKKTNHQSFAEVYLDLYNNNMPVFITSDSILHAFHKFYEKLLKSIETDTLIHKFDVLCSQFLNSLCKVEINDQNKDILQALEVYFMVPYVIMQLRNELSSPLSYEDRWIFPLDEIKKELETYEPTKEIVQNELDNGFTKGNPQSIYEIYQEKTKYISNILGIEKKKFIRIAIRSPKYYTILKEFKFADLNKKITFKFGGDKAFHQIIEKLSSYQDIEMSLCGVTIKMMGSMFKPRGHYTTSLELKKYFLAFTWLSNFVICFDRKKDEYANSIILATIISKVAEPFQKTMNGIQDFIGKIIGQSDDYTSKEFLDIINQVIPKTENLTETIGWIQSHAQELCHHCSQNLKKISTLTKFGDKLNKEITTHAFSIIGKGTQIDNEIIQKMVDNRLVDDNGLCPLRKFTSVYELVYTLFNNNSAKKTIQYRMVNNVVNQRDGFKYNNYLEQMNESCQNVVFGDTIYGQELKMLRSLTSDLELFKDKMGINAETWLLKEAQTQIGHYTELRHDNVLCLAEAASCFGECMHPELFVEPVPTFWREFLVLIKMLKGLVSFTDEKNLRILDNYENLINKFIIYLDQYLSSGTVDPVLVDDLKGIISEYNTGSGIAIMKGWYVKLFDDQADTWFKPEISSLFAGVNDIRGPGGVVHLGNVGAQVMYLLIKDSKTESQKIVLGPVYSTYEFITEYGNRLNDDEWKKVFQNYQPLDFNK